MTDLTTPAESPTMEALVRMERDNDALRERYQSALNEISEFKTKTKNVEGVIRDYYSENGEMLDELTKIAEYLDITITKRISGSATFEISWSAQVPLDFDADDFEISFDVDCDTYEADDFEWHEENAEVTGEDDDY